MGEHLKRRHFAMFAAAAGVNDLHSPCSHHGLDGRDLGPTGFSRDASHPAGMSSEDRQRLQDGVRRQNQRSEERARGATA